MRSPHTGSHGAFLRVFQFYRNFSSTVLPFLVYPLGNCNALKHCGFCNYTAYACQRVYDSVRMGKSVKRDW